MAKKKIGLLGGISYVSTVSYYRGIMELYHKLYNDYYYPEVIIYSLDFQKFTDYEDIHDYPSYITYINEGIDGLIRAGAEVIAFTANSPHKVFNDVREHSSVPMISIVEAVAEEAQRLHMKRLLLFGIKFTMQSGFYADVFRKYDMEIIVPSAEEQERINNIIFNELAVEQIHESSKKFLKDVIARYNTDGVILGCTELPLILDDGDAKVPLLNSVQLHVKTILKHALQEARVI